MHLNFDEVFKFVVVILKKGGGHPYTRRDLKWAIKVSIFFGIPSLIQISLTYGTLVYDASNDLTQACANSSLITMYGAVCIMFYVLLMYPDSLRLVLDKVKKDYEIANNILPPDEKICVVNFARKGQFIANAWGTMSVLVTSSFFVRSLVGMTYYALMSDFTLVEFYPITFIPSIQDIKFNAPVFWIIYISWVWTAIFMCSVYMAVVPLAPLCMCHACGQLEIFKNRLMKLFSEETTTDQEREEKLKIIIRELQDVYEFVNEIQKIFIIFYEIILKGACIIMPTMLYEILDTVKKHEFHPNFFTVFGSTVVLSAIPCYYGDLLTEQGDSFRNTLYMSNWETQWDKRTRIMLILMMTRAQRAISVRGVFREVNREALADVYRQAYTLFNFMIAAWG